MEYHEFEALRNSLGLTNGQVAKYSGVSTATLSQWKKGVYKPKERTLAKIEDMFISFGALELNPITDSNGNRIGNIGRFSPVIRSDINLDKDIRNYEFIQTMDTSTVKQTYTIDSVTSAFERPVELSEYQYKELKKASEAFIDSWLRIHKKLN